ISAFEISLFPRCAGLFWSNPSGFQRLLLLARVDEVIDFAAMRKSAFDAVDGSSTRHVSATDMGVTKAPMIRRSYLCKQLRQLVSTSQSQCFRCTALMLPAKW